MKPLFLHIDIIDISIFVLVNLYILFEKFSKKKDTFDSKGESYSFTRQFWPVYWDNYAKVIILTTIGLLVKDEVGMPILDYVIQKFAPNIDTTQLLLNYTLTAITVYVLGKWGVKFKDDEKIELFLKKIIINPNTHVLRRLCSIWIYTPNICIFRISLPLNSFCIILKSI